jgi:hypothetical protein
MKRALLIIILLCPALLVMAQQPVVTISPSTVNADDVIDLNDAFFEIVGYSTITNVSNTPVTLRWQRINPSNLPMGWESLICDNTSCYPPFVSSNIMPEFDLNAPVVLAPGATSNLDVHLRPNQLPGSTTIRVQVTAVGDTAVLATGTFNFSAVLTSNSYYGARNQDVKVFPNPVTDYFQISSGTKITKIIVQNALGRQVRSFDAYDGRRYSLSGLPDGMYLVSLYDGRGLAKTVRVIKRGFRP